MIKFISNRAASRLFGVLLRHWTSRFKPKEPCLPTARLLVFTPLAILMVALSAFAQNQQSGPALKETYPEGESITISPPIARPVMLPNKPEPQEKVIDKKFIGVMAALAGAETLRFTTHKLVLDHEFAAGAPWVTKVPGNSHLVGKYGALFAAEWLVAYELKKPHSWLPGDKYLRKFWWAYPAVMTTVHIKNGVRNIRTQAPADCPPEFCGGQ